MIKITATVRAALRQVLANSREYDATTLRVGRDGAVTALKDADKTYAGNDRTRYLVGYAADMVTQDGTVVEGH